MSDWPNARHSSGIEPFGSTETLPSMSCTSPINPFSCHPTAHAAGFGGGFEGHEGQVPGESEKGDIVATTPKIPFYKRRNFIICQVVFAIIGIVMIFVMLWPVVHAIAQHVLDVSEMHIESSVIQSPSNESFTVSPFS
jgi:hypothetical protein